MLLIFRRQKDKAFCSFKIIFLQKPSCLWAADVESVECKNGFTNGQKKRMLVTSYEHFWRLEHLQSFQKKHRCSWQDSRCVDAKSGHRNGLSDRFAVLLGIQGGGKELSDHVFQQESLFEPRHLRRQEASPSSTDFHQVSQKWIFTSWYRGF